MFDGVIDVNEVFSNENVDSTKSLNDFNIEVKHRVLRNDFKRKKTWTKKDAEGRVYYAVPTDEFKKYCEFNNFREKELRTELRVGGYLYIDKNKMYHENTRVCRVDGKRIRCLCIYM